MLHITDTDVLVANYLKDAEIQYTVIPMQQDAVDDDNWTHDIWTVLFDGVAFVYRMGTGHRISPFLSKDTPTSKRLRKLTGYTGPFPQTKELRHNKNSCPLDGYALAVPPTQALVLYSLLLDADAGSETFNDFCDNYSHSNDSHEAERLYFACQEIGENLRKIFTSEQISDLKTMLEEY